jgi:hypothetical protein
MAKKLITVWRGFKVRSKLGIFLRNFSNFKGPQKFAFLSGF